MSKYPYQNSKLPVEERVEDLLSRMTLDEKMREMMMKPADMFVKDGTREFSAEKADAYFDGISIGLLEAPKFTPQDNVKYINALQKYLTENTRLGIPALVISECLHGYMTPEATVFPQAINLASTWNPELIEKTASAIAAEVASCGVRQGLGPDLDLAREPRWGRVEETYGEDPYLCGEIGISYMKGLQGQEDSVPVNKIAATPKHFCAHGSPDGGVNLSPVPCGDRQLRELYLPPFARAVREGKALSLMPAYSEFDGVPCSSNEYLLEDVLRKELGFRGYTFSDYGTVEMLHFFHNTAESFAEAGRQALVAGLDTECPNSRCYDHLKGMVEDGSLDISYVDRAVRRMLYTKFMLGLFEQSSYDEDAVAKTVRTEENLQLARKVAQESIVLLKNDKVLPLSKNVGTIAVIGPNADSIELGDYTVCFDKGVTLLEGIRNHVSDETKVLYAKGCELYEKDNIRDQDAWDEAIRTAQQADVIVVGMGNTSNKDYGIGWGVDTGKAVTCGEGYDVTDLGLSGAQEDLLEALLQLGKPVVLVLINGRPVTLPCIDQIAGLVETWYAGEEAGNAIADVLFGDVNPSGKLPITFPKTTGQIPLFYNCKPSARGIYHMPGSSGNPGRDYVFDDTNPMFPFGFGLSYTTFEYSDLKVTPAQIKAGESVTVEVTVKNTGDREGAEVVQLYLHDVFSTTTTPLKALKGFRKILLQPGEEKRVTMQLTAPDMALVDLKYRYKVEGGEFRVMIDKLTASFQVQGDCFVDHM